MKATPAQADRLHGFAHDLRNRLAGMQQVLRMLARPDSGMDAGELSVFAEQQFFKAMRSVEGLLDDLAVERGTGMLTTVPVDLAEMARQGIGHMKHRFERKEQVVEEEIPPSLSVLADAQHLEQLVAALLSNASKFTHPGGRARVTVRRDGAQGVLEVADTGVGLTGPDLAQVFVRYAWLRSRSTAGEEQGRSTLARARQWAEAMAGTLVAESQGEDAGSTFTLRLPLAE